MENLPLMVCSILFIFCLIVFYKQERELSELKREKAELEHERISILQKCNEALMMAKHPEYFEDKQQTNYGND